MGNFMELFGGNSVHHQGVELEEFNRYHRHLCRMFDTCFGITRFGDCGTYTKSYRPDLKPGTSFKYLRERVDTYPTWSYVT